MRHVLVTGLLLLAAISMGCQSGTESEPELTTLFQKELDALREKFDFPGATAAYALADGTTGIVATGLADIESETAMRPTSRMLAASIGKTFVSATVLGLAQDGKLGLDDSASQWLGDEPWFSRLPNHQDMTIRHLLTHRAGLVNHVDTTEFAAAFAYRSSLPGLPFEPD